jgi:hypothetical protein
MKLEIKSVESKTWLVAFRYLKVTIVGELKQIKVFTDKSLLSITIFTND